MIPKWLPRGSHGHPKSIKNQLLTPKRPLWHSQGPTAPKLTSRGAKITPKDSPKWGFGIKLVQKGHSDALAATPTIIYVYTSIYIISKGEVPEHPDRRHRPQGLYNNYIDYGKMSSGEIRRAVWRHSYAGVSGTSGLKPTAPCAVSCVTLCTKSFLKK